MWSCQCVGVKRAAAVVEWLGTQCTVVKHLKSSRIGSREARADPGICCGGCQTLQLSPTGDAEFPALHF